MKRFLQGILVLLAIAGFAHRANGQMKIQDLCKIQNADDHVLIGYGLVTGLDRTGDRTIMKRGATFTVQSIANMLKKFGISVDPSQLQTRNVAAVMVTADVSPYNATGSNVDVTVSSLGDASSLSGGVLLQTPLIDPNDPNVEARAQGALVSGDLSAEVPGARVSQNPSLTATIPNGGIVVKNKMFSPDNKKPFGLVLLKPDYTNAQNISNAIAKATGAKTSVENAGLISVQWPQNTNNTGAMNKFIAQVMATPVNVEVPARVVINERSGTIVAGGNVRIGQVMVSHGNVQIQTRLLPYVSQPSPFSKTGKTVQGNVPQAGIAQQNSKTFVLQNNTTVGQLATALNNLGMSPRDIIAIFQAIDRAGALKGKLIIM